MKFATLSYTFTLFAATALAFKFPVRKTSRHSLSRRSGSASILSYSPHDLASLPNAVPDNANLRYVLAYLWECTVRSELALLVSSIDDMIYVTNVRSVFINFTRLLTIYLDHARGRSYVSRPAFAVEQDISSTHRISIAIGYWLV